MNRETTIHINMELKTESLKVADTLVKKMLSPLTPDDLELIGQLKTTKTLAEMEVGSDVFDKENEDDEDEDIQG